VCAPNKGRCVLCERRKMFLEKLSFRVRDVEFLFDMLNKEIHQFDGDRSGCVFENGLIDLTYWDHFLCGACDENFISVEKKFDSEMLFFVLNVMTLSELKQRSSRDSFVTKEKTEKVK
jgi:hypothetical protein